MQKENIHELKVTTTSKVQPGKQVFRYVLVKHDVAGTPKIDSSVVIGQ